MTGLAAFYLFFACAFFLALPVYKNSEVIDRGELVARLFMSALWPFFLTVAIFKRIINP
jgi:hypothetical protein